MLGDVISFSLKKPPTNQKIPTPNSQTGVNKTRGKDESPNNDNRKIKVHISICNQKLLHTVLGKSSRKRSLASSEDITKSLGHMICMRQ